MSELVRRWRRCFTSLGALLIAGASQAAASSDPCSNAGIVFGFFNGVQTTEKQADVALKTLTTRYLTISTHGDEITYELFYNNTNGLEDFVETFEQRLKEHDQLLAQRFELFFSVINGDDVWWRVIMDAIPEFLQVQVDLVQLKLASLAKHMTTLLASPDTFAVLQRHREQLDRWTSEEKSLLLVAHSQGNLFVNKAYEHALQRAKAASVKVVHIAPASPLLTGPYTLADKDLVIHGLLRLTGKVVSATDVMPAYFQRAVGVNGETDVLGHGLLAVYLNSTLSVFNRVNGHILAALDALHQADRNKTADLPPFPPFESIPFGGGPEPRAVLEFIPPSHAIKAVSRKLKYETVFERVDKSFLHTIRGHKYLMPYLWERAPKHPEHAHLDAVDYDFTSGISVLGPRMDGSRKCVHKSWRAGVKSAAGEDIILREEMCTDVHYLNSVYVYEYDAKELQGRYLLGDRVTTGELTFKDASFSRAIHDGREGFPRNLWFSNGRHGTVTSLVSYRHGAQTFQTSKSTAIDERVYTSENVSGIYSVLKYTGDIHAWRRANKVHADNEARRAAAYNAAYAEHAKARAQRARCMAATVHTPSSGDPTATPSPSPSPPGAPRTAQ